MIDVEKQEAANQRDQMQLERDQAIDKVRKIKKSLKVREQEAEAKLRHYDELERQKERYKGLSQEIRKDLIHAEKKIRVIHKEHKVWISRFGF